MLVQDRADDGAHLQARRPLARPWLVLLAIPAVFAGLYVLLDFHFVFNNDTLGYVYPTHLAVRDALTQGQFPFWNAGEGCGTQLFVDTGVAVLESGLLLAMSVKDMIVTASLLHVLAGLIFFYLFARQLGISSRGAVLGAIIWVFNGYHAWYMSDLNIFGINLFLPLVLLAAWRFVNGGGLGWIVLGAVGLGCQFLHARPTDYAYDLLIVACFILYCVWSRPHTGARVQGAPARGGRAIAFLVGVVTIGLLLTMFYMLPFIENMRQSMRFSSVTLRTNNLLFASPAEMLVPNVWAPMLTRGDLADRLRYGSAATPLSSRGFFGLAVIPLLILSWRSRNRYRPFFFALGLAGLLLVFPLGLFELSRRLPMHGGAVEPVRLIVLVMLSAAMLAGMGYDSLFAPAGADGAPGRRPRFISLRTVAIASAVLLVGIAVIGLIGTFANWHAVAVVLLSAAAVTALNLAWRGRLNRSAAYWFFVAALLGTLLLATFGDRSDDDLKKKERAFFAKGPPPPAVACIRQDPKHDLFRVADYGRMLPQTFWSRHELNSVCYYLAAPERRSLQYFHDLTGDKFWTVSDVRNAASVFYDLASLRYVLYPADPNTATPPAWFRPLTKDRPAKAILWENPRAYPRAYFVDGWQAVAEDADALAFMKQKGLTDPEWFRRHVLLDRPPEGGPFGAEHSGKLLKLEQSPNQVRLRIRLDQAAILVLTDTYDDSWHATVDGMSTPLLRANFMFRAVAVPAGEHVVEFRCLPETFVRDVYISLATVVVVVALLLLCAAWRRLRGDHGRPTPATSTPPSGG